MGKLYERRGIRASKAKYTCGDKASCPPSVFILNRCGKRLGTAVSVDSRRHDSAGISRSFAARIQPADFDMGERGIVPGDAYR